VADFEMFSGEMRTFTIALTLSDGSGAPFPLNDVSIVFEMKSGLANPDSGALITRTTPSGIVVTDAANGKAQILLAIADTIALVGVYRCGIKVFPGALEVAEFTLRIRRPVVVATIPS